MAKKHYGGIDLQTQSKLRLFESTDTNYVSLKAPTLAGNLDLILPATDTANGALVSTGSAPLPIALIANANVSGSAAIAYSKLNLSGSIVNADVANAAAIAYSKLNLSASIVNADIASGAAIARNKLAALTANRAVVTDGSGFDTVSATTDTEIGYVSGVTSAIQTQINGKVSLTGNEVIAGIKTFSSAPLLKTALDIEDPGAGTFKVTIQAPTLAASYTLILPVDDGTPNQILSTDGSGVLSWVNQSTITSFKANWITADGTTKTVTHSLADSDVIVQLYDKATNETIEVDSVVRTDANTVTLTASVAPNASGWRVLILAV